MGSTPPHEKPSFTVSTTTTEDSITVSISNGVNIDHASILNVNADGDLVGNMMGSGANWTYTINGLCAGTYTYQAIAYSKPNINNVGTDADVTRVPFSATIVVEKAKITNTVYGFSGEGRPLNVISIVPPGATSKILVTFEIHGFEDDYANDGWALVNIGNRVVEYFSTHPEMLNGKALYVIVSANPDALVDGWTNNGPGRCQISGGVDINRDFDYCWRPYYNSRNKTLSPFSCPESRALRDLVINLRPDDVIDIHGWLATTYGTASLDRFFENCIGIGRSGSLDSANGYFSTWARGAGYCQRSALVELPSPYVDPQNVVNAFINLCANYYF